jgi:hypothetical protein
VPGPDDISISSNVTVQTIPVLTAANPFTLKDRGTRFMAPPGRGLIRIRRANMNERRQLLGAVGLGSLLAGVTAVVPGEGFAATAKPRPTLRPIPPDQRPQYRVFTVPAGDSIEDAFNAVAREGFHYAGSAQRYGHTEFIFVKWVVAEPMISENALS